MRQKGSNPGPGTGVRHRSAAVGCAALGAAGLWCLGAAPSRAETDRSSPMQFLIQENARAQSSAGQSAPVARVPKIHHAAPTFRRVLMQRATTEPRQRLAIPAASAPAPTTVAVFGDRLGQALATGLQDAGGSSVSVSPLTSEDAGLTRSDFEPWLQSLRERMAKPDHAAVAVVMIGSNDKQSLPDQGANVAPETPRWAELYGTRVDAVANVFRQAHVPLIWVGLPPVRSEETSAEFVRLNGIFRERAARDGTTYVDSWEAFSDDAGNYSPIGPDMQGQSVKLRKADGFSFTRAGARKLASFVEGDVKRLHRPGTAAPASEVAAITIDKARDFDQVLDIDVNAQIRREAGLSPETAVTMVGRAVEPAKPAAGPVLPLTAPPLSPDGHLTSVSDAAPGIVTAMQASVVIRPATGGAPVAPQPGRADDFSWPR